MIVSATESPADVLGVLDLTDEPVAVVPLFETIADLESAADDGARAARRRALRRPRRRARRTGSR